MWSLPRLKSRGGNSPLLLVKCIATVFWGENLNPCAVAHRCALPTASCSRLSADAKHDEAVTSAKSSTYKKLSTPSGMEDGRPLTARAKRCSLIRYPEVLPHVECTHPKR